jgi:hypothetical protein
MDQQMMTAWRKEVRRLQHTPVFTVEMVQLQMRKVLLTPLHRIGIQQDAAVEIPKLTSTRTTLDANVKGATNFRPQDVSILALPVVP